MPSVTSYPNHLAANYTYFNHSSRGTTLAALRTNALVQNVMTCAFVIHIQNPAATVAVLCPAGMDSGIPTGDDFPGWMMG